MGRTREFDIDSALKIAADLFWRKGYEGTSVSELTVAIGITAPSFYFAFGSKEGLFERVLADYQQLHNAIVHDALGQGTVQQVIEKLLYGYVELLTEPGRAPGCLIMNNALPVTESHSFRKKFADQRKAFRLNLQNRFEALGLEAGLSNDDPAALAHLIVVLIWGLAVEAQSGASRAELQQTVAVFLTGRKQ